MDLKKQVDKNVNVDANIMSFTFGLAARAFWAGAQWIGPTGTSHTSLSIGSFNTIKAKSSEGASEMIRQVAKSFEIQLSAMTGIIVPPANTGIPPLTFVGYK